MRCPTWSLLALLLGCTSKEPGTGPGGDDTAAPTEPTEPLPEPAALAEVSGGDCPDLSSPGEFEINANGRDRSGLIYFPEEAEGPMPMIFAWHPLGASASLMKRYLDLEDLAEELGVIAVIPEADPSALFEWGFMGGADNDLVLYDDLRSCIAEQHDADLSRVSSTGFSAGALWTTLLAIERGDTLSSVLVFSGGTDPVITYSTPGGTFAALLLHGGETDSYDAVVMVIDFQAATLAFAESLHADGHFVGIGNHDLGHTLPRDAAEIAAAWLPVHQYGAPSPFAEGGIEEVADWLEAYKPE